ncbi:DUF4350 domain-containing protein [Marinilabiliaceae bacterium JC017]|nr:DUF4350 domain-containing protein [Marinilabiliaceae bacterium JC017]
MAKSSTNNWMMIGVLAAILLFSIALAMAPKAIDWSLSFSRQDEIPFGNSILYELLPEHFAHEELVTVHSGLTSYLEETTPENSNLIIINHRFKPDQRDLNKIIDILNAGNSVFIAAEYLSEAVADTFNIEFNETQWLNILGNDSISFNFSNRKLKSAYGYWYKKGISNNHFVSYDSTRTSVLGFNNDGLTNFIKIKQGKGWLYVNLNPLAFSNYNLLIADNYEYVFKCLSYLPAQPTLWDEYYKARNNQIASPISFILNRKPLRYAWYLVLAGVLVYFIFESKRKQRMIPVITPPENTTLSFIETVGRLYFSRKNHLDIAQKKYSYFLEHIRSKYYVQTDVISDERIQHLAAKTGIARRSLKQLFSMAENLKQVKKLSEEDLEQFNRKIEYFYQHSH